MTDQALGRTKMLQAKLVREAGSNGARFTPAMSGLDDSHVSTVSVDDDGEDDDDDDDGRASPIGGTNLEHLVNGGTLDHDSEWV